MFERKDGASSPFENNLNRSAGLNGNYTTPSSCEFGKKCAWMHHQTDEQSSRSEKWLKFSGNVEYVWQLVKNASGWRAAEVFTETTEEHRVLRPMKRAKIHKSHTVTEKGPSCGKNWSYRASWRGGHVPKFAMRQQRKAWVQSTNEVPRESRCYFSGVSQRRTEREFKQLPEHTAQFKTHYAFQRMELITPTKRGSSAKLGTTAVLFAWISAKPTDWTPEVNYHISLKRQKIQYYAENFVFLVVQGFKDSFFMLYLTEISEFVIAGTMNILFCVQQQYEVRIRVNKHKETCYKPSHRMTNKHGETRHRLNCHEERCNRKRSHTHFLKDRNFEMQEGQNYLDSMQEAHRWSRTSSSKIWENWKQQSTKSKLRLWIGKPSPIRYRGAKFGGIKIRDETKLLKADMESFLGIWH